MPEAPAVLYGIAMHQPTTHRFEVRIEVPNPPAPGIRFRMPAWTPGSYLIREFSRHVEEVRATDRAGIPVPCRKVDKATWEVESGGEAVVLRYQVYAHDLTVRTSHLDASHGFFNGGNVFFRVEGLDHAPSELVVTPPEGWIVSTGLPRIGTGAWRFAVADFDDLVDSPVECGPHTEHRFSIGGVSHRWVFWGEGNQDLERVLRDVQRIGEQEIALFGDLPADVDDYLFICHLQERWNGGLEHRNSQVIGVQQLCFRDPREYERFLTLVAHEYFHLWNVKRIRAAGLGPFDYDSEVYTPLLWMMEGITAYYDTLIPTRAGLISTERYLAIVGERLAQLRAVPGRFVQSLEASSFDAWIKLYRRDENTENSTISYYLKGEVAVMALDLHIRHETGGERSFDDVMRTLWARQKKTGQAIEPGEVAGLIAQATGVDCQRELGAWIQEPGDIALEELLGKLGVEAEGSWKERHGPWDGRVPAKGDDDEAVPAAWLGLSTETRGGRIHIQSVRTDGPCHLADVCAGDEWVALEGYRVQQGTWKSRLALWAPGDRVRLTLFRRQRLLESEVVLAHRPHDTYEVKASDDVDDHIRSLRDGWLGSLADG